MYGGIQDRGDQDFDILGDVFLKNVYAVGALLTAVLICRFGMLGILDLGLFRAHWVLESSCDPLRV